MEANQTFINAIINSVVNLVITRIGELGLVSDIHKRLDDIEKKVDERKPELEQSLEMLLQQSTWFGDLIAKQVDMRIEEQDIDSNMRNIAEEVIDACVNDVVTSVMRFLRALVTWTWCPTTDAARSLRRCLTSASTTSSRV